MADTNFIVKNGLVVNGSFVANGTHVNAAAIAATSLHIANASANVVITPGSIAINGSEVARSGADLSAANLVASSVNATSAFITNLTVTGNANISNVGSFSATTLNLGNNTLSTTPLTVATNSAIAINVISSNVTAISARASSSNASVVLSENLSNGIAMHAIANTGTALNITSKSGTLLIASNNTTEFMRITANGNIGIGNTTPASKLVVNGDTQTTSVNSGQLAGFRNALINGDFDIWQRGTSFVITDANIYTADRWVVTFNGTGGSRTISRQSFDLGQTEVPNNPQYFLRFNQTTAGSGANFNVLQQLIEGVRKYAGQRITLSFYAKANTSITLPEIQIRQFFGTGGSPSAFVDTNFVQNQVITDTWTRYTMSVNVPSVTGKSLGTNGDDYLGLMYGLPENQTFIFDISQVQLEVGSVATPFERRSEAIELAMCQRYYEQATNLFSGWSGSFTNNYALTRFRVQKRATPTLSVISQSNYDGPSTYYSARTILEVNNNYFIASGQSTGSSQSANWVDTWAASSELF